MAGGITTVSSASEFESVLNASSDNDVVLLHFYAEWAPQCKVMENVIEELSKDNEIKGIKFVKVEAESVQDISQKYKVTSVPTFIFLKNKQIVDRLDGADSPQLIKKVKNVAGSGESMPQPPKSDPAAQKEELNKRLKQLINFAPCMLFMKGTPTEPRCGFSRQVIELLSKYNAEYSTFNILADEQVRQGLKEYSNWPTYPQLYINGELVGGLDILKELAESGELEKMLPKKQELNKRLEALIKKAPLMVFMKGSPETPLCGFSRTLVSILNETGIPYETFNILEDEEVRQGLKTYSNWPTYPQVYVNGELIGGLDIIKELKEAGELEKTLKGEQ